MTEYEIVNYSYTEETKYYETMIKISEQDIPEIRKLLMKFFDTDYMEEEKKENGKNAAGRKMISDENNQNYLYIYAVIDVSQYEYMDSYQGIKL